MTDTRLDAQFQESDRLVSLVSSLLVSLMLACVTIAVVQLGQALLPGWRVGLLVPLSLIVSLEAIYAQRAIRRYPVFSTDWVLRRFSEWVFILVVLKLSEFATRGPTQLLAEIPLWAQDFKTYFITADYLVACSVIFVIWGLSTEFAELLVQLEVNERLLAQERETGVSEDRSQLRQKLLSLIMIVGGVLIIFTTLLRTDWEFIWQDRPPLQVGTANLLVYFILALILLSLTQFSLLRIQWSLGGISISRGLVKRWIYYSAGFLFLLVSLTSLLPTQYTIGLLEMLSLFAALLVNLLTLLTFLLLLPISLLFNFLMSLFNTNGDSPQMTVQAPPELVPRQPAGNSWLELVASILFWVIFIGVIGFAVYYYLQQRRDLWEYLRNKPLLSQLGRLWEAIRAWLMGVNQSIVAAVDASLERIRKFQAARLGVESPIGFISLRRLTARQRVFFYYLAMLRRSKERGLPRHPDQTPYEYAGDLNGWFPGAQEEVSTLTDVFVEAKFSLHEVTDQHVGLVRQSWERIKKALQKEHEG